jgi:hypothetical protein
MTRFSVRKISVRKNSSTQVFSLFLLGALFLTPSILAPSIVPDAAQAGTRSTPTAQSARPSRQVVRQVRQLLAEQFNVSRSTLRMISYSRETWPNGCLGLQTPNVRCAGNSVEGWRVEMTNGQQNWIYRTNMTGSVLAYEPMATDPTLPPEVQDKLLQAIAKQEKVAASSLRVGEIRPTTWDGCLGLAEPGQACIQIAISGWQVIVTGTRQSWVYHVSEDGNRIAKNVTASGSKVVPTFATSDESPYGQPTNIIFRAIEAGGLAGIVTERVLGADGTLYRQTINPRGGRSSDRTSDRTVERRLNKAEVLKFEALLVSQKFNQLNHLRYLSNAAFADYPTITLQSPVGTVEYIDLETENVPTALREVIRAWNAL